MNETDINSPGQDDLTGQVAALQRQVFALLLALIVVSGTLVAYLGYESHHIGKDINNINAQIVVPYHQKQPAIDAFLSQIIVFGQSHPDFRPVLAKYGITLPTNGPAKPGAPKK